MPIPQSFYIIIHIHWFKIPGISNPTVCAPIMNEKADTDETEKYQNKNDLSHLLCSGYFCSHRYQKIDEVGDHVG